MENKTLHCTGRHHDTPFRLYTDGTLMMKIDGRWRSRPNVCGQKYRERYLHHKGLIPGTRFHTETEEVRRTSITASADSTHLQREYERRFTAEMEDYCQRLRDMVDTMRRMTPAIVEGMCEKIQEVFRECVDAGDEESKEAQDSGSVHGEGEGTHDQEE